MSCIRAYSPLSTIFEPFSGCLAARTPGRTGPSAPSGCRSPNCVDDLGHVVGDVAEVAAVHAHRQVDRRLDVRVRHLGRHGRAARGVIRLRSGIGFFWSGLVIGMFSSVSIDLMSSSGYCTPTKYWLWLTGSIQKFFLLNWMLRVERGDDVLHDVLLGQAQVGGLGPVDVDDVLGVVEPLDDPGVDDAVDLGRPWPGSARRSRGPASGSCR